MGLKSGILALGLVAMLSGCGDQGGGEEDPQSPPPSNTGQGSGGGSANPIPPGPNPPRYPWSEVVSQWQGGLTSPDVCNKQSLEIDNDGTFELRGCGQVRNGKVDSADFAELDAATRGVLDRLNRTLKCFNDGVAYEYIQDNMVKAPGSRIYRTIYENGDSGQICYRGDLESSKAFGALMARLLNKYAGI